MDTKLCLYGDAAKAFMTRKIGDKMTLRLDAIVTKTAIEPDYGDGMMVGDTPDKQAVVEFSVTAINGKPASYNDMTPDQMEQEIQDVYQGKAKPNIEDGESIWTKVKRDEKLTRTPFPKDEKTIVR